MGLPSSTTHGDDPNISWAFTRLAPHENGLDPPRMTPKQLLLMEKKKLLLMDVGSPL
jgi:hypothetical protein